MNQTRLVSSVFAILGFSLLLWLSYDASDVALTLGLESTLGEAGVALLGLCASGAMLLVAAAIPLRARFGRHGGTDRGHRGA
jgi:hypothetical protein